MSQPPYEPEITYVNNVDFTETFIDSIGPLLFDNQTMRIEMCITRMDVPIPSKPPTGKRYPACRLVLTPSAMIQLHHKLSNLMDALAEQGVIQKGEPIPTAHPVAH